MRSREEDREAHGTRTRPHDRSHSGAAWMNLAPEAGISQSARRAADSYNPLYGSQVSFVPDSNSDAKLHNSTRILKSRWNAFVTGFNWLFLVYIC